MTELLGGRYELRRLLGRGAMADVTEAYDRKLDRIVAVKLLRAEVADPRARERLEREARAAASFLHPNAVTIFDVSDDGARPYIVMELVEGRSLADLLAERGPLDPAEATSIAEQVLAALGAAHERGLVHRDVKPANVLIDRGGSAKLADFGIAKALSDATAGLTGTGQVMGTPTYLAPEQASGEGATPRSDLYAVGVVLYEMLAGTPPFAADNVVALAMAHRQAPVPPLVDRCPDVPPNVAAAIERALEKDPERRFRDAAAMRAALSRSADPTVPMTVVAAPRPTEVMPEVPRLTDETPAAVRPRRSARLWVLGVVVVAIALGALALGSALRDDAGTGAPSTAPTTSPPETSPPETSPAQATTLEELIALLAADPAAYGEKGDDLLKSLQAIVENPEAQGERAAKAIADIEGWTDTGQLDPDIGALATNLLTPLATEQGGGPPDTAGKGDGGKGGD